MSKKNRSRQRHKKKPKRPNRAKRTGGARDDGLSPEAMIARYETAAGKAAVTELKLRILAEVIPPLEQHAHDGKLENVENRIFGWFVSIGEPLSDTEQSRITTTRQFRNKLLHGELHTARQKMHSLGAPPRTGGVMHMKFGDGPKLQQILDALQNNTMTRIADTTTQDTGIAGWLMDMGLAGDFENACTVCENASALIDSLIDRANAYFIRQRLRNATLPQPAASDEA